jgi:AcrR family transcriptional regulator
MAKKQQEEPKAERDVSTEEKILQAARKVFTQKGYAATRTRDIAAEAGINLALLNYYFRSKEKLFHQVMAENLQQFFGIIAPIISDEQTTLETKVKLIAEAYIDELGQHPDLPLFVLSEIRNDPEQFKTRIPIDRLLPGAALFRQLQERRPDIHPMQFIINMLGMCVFAFVARPVFLAAGLTTEEGFAAMMEERKRLIPGWVEAMLKA